MSEFYVYQHRRKDTGAVFYVGKGKGDRAYSRHSRNRHWKFVVAKAGLPEVDIVASELDEEMAHLAECELIDKLRLLGAPLVNMTSGGDGTSGLRHSEESKARLREANLGERNRFYGKKHSAEALARMSASHLGWKDSDATRARKSAARMADRNPRFGVVITHEQKERQRATLIATLAASRAACPHCGVVADKINAKRWHFDNCRSK